MRPRSAVTALVGTLLGAALVLGGGLEAPALLRQALTPGGAAAPADDPSGAGGALGASDAPAATPDPDEAAAYTPAAPPTATPEPTPTPTPTAEPVSNPVLHGHLTALLADPRLDGGRLTLHVVDADEREVFAHDADAPVLPASTVKLVTAAAALAELGPDFRFTTTVRAAAEPRADGVIEGDLVVVGGGDPALASPLFSAHVMTERPRTPLEALADQVHAAGVRRVTGRVLGDPSVLPHEPEAGGWLERYLRRGDATRSSGLTVDAGRRVFEANGQLHSAPADDPAAEAAAALTALLDERGVAVDGGATAAVPPAAGHVLASVESPRLQDLLVYMVQRSDNHLADAVFRAVGGARGDGTWAGSAVAVRDALDPLRLDFDGVVLADGSGLSRDDRLPARLLTTLDARMHASNRAAEWRETMAVSGRSGTLRRRLIGTVAEGKLTGKTGTLSDTRTLSGTVDGPEGTRYHFAFMAVDLEGEQVAAARELQDLVVLALAEDLHGCVRVPVPDPSPEAQAGAEPATEVRCAA